MFAKKFGFRVHILGHEKNCPFEISAVLGFSFCIRPKPKSWFRSLTITVVGQTVAILMPSWQTNGSTYSHKRMHKKYTDFTKQNTVLIKSTFCNV